MKLTWNFQTGRARPSRADVTECWLSKRLEQERTLLSQRARKNPGYTKGAKSRRAEMLPKMEIEGVSSQILLLI